MESQPESESLKEDIPEDESLNEICQKFAEESIQDPNVRGSQPEAEFVMEKSSEADQNLNKCSETGDSAPAQGPSRYGRTKVQNSGPRPQSTILDRPVVIDLVPIASPVPQTNRKPSTSDTSSGVAPVACSEEIRNNEGVTQRRHSYGRVGGVKSNSSTSLTSSGRPCISEESPSARPMMNPSKLVFSFDSEQSQHDVFDNTPQQDQPKTQRPVSYCGAPGSFTFVSRRENDNHGRVYPTTVEEGPSEEHSQGDKEMSFREKRALFASKSNASSMKN